MSSRKGWHLILFMEKDKICSFFGHRTIEATSELCANVNSHIIKAIDLGCKIFYFGGFGDFDELCYQTVSKIKKEQPDLGIKRIYCVPQERNLRKTGRIFEKYDEIKYLIPSFEGWYKSIYFRNCAIIDESYFIVFYVEERENSGAYKAYKYARKKKKDLVFNLWNNK